MGNRSTTLKKGLSLLLSIFLILPLITTTAYSAEGYDPNATQGSGGNAETITGGTGFSLAHQGYRISILSGNQPFPGVEKPVQDMWYSTPPSDVQYKDTNRLGMATDAAKDNLIGQGNLDKINIPKAIILDENGNFAANGIAVREYLLGGSGGSPSSPGGSGGGGGGPTINWGGGSTPTRSQLAEKYNIEKGREEQAVNLARYYNNKLKSFYDKAVKDAGTDRGMTPDEFRERLNYYADKYRVDINNKFANDHDWGVYGDGMEGYVLELLENNVSSLSMAYTIKYNRESQGHYFSTSNSTSRVKGAYVKEGDSILITKEEIPLAEAEGGNGEVPLTTIICNLFSDGSPEGSAKLINDINSDHEFRILLESIVWYWPRTLIRKADGKAVAGPDIGIKVAGTAKNIADFNLASSSLLGGVNGQGMGNLTNGGLPKGLLLEKDDTVLNLLMPTDPGEGNLVVSSAIASNYGWGTHIYDKNSGGTHTWDSAKFPDGTPGPAPEPPGPGAPTNPDEPETPSDPDTPDNGYNITIIKFYESNNVPESNFTREHNPGTIAVEDEPIYHLVDWFYSPDKLVPTSQSTVYDDTKVQALVTGTGTSEATVNVVTPDTTLYLKLVKQDKAPANPTQQFILKESEVTKAYNSQQVQAGASWPTGDIFHWAGDSLGSGKCTAIIGYTCDCDDDDCSGCVQLTFPCSTDIIQKRN